jgi:hypothetical protein
MPKAPAGWLADRSSSHLQYTRERIGGLPSIYLFGAEKTDGMPEVVLVLIFLVAVVIPWVRLIRRPDMLLWCIWFAGTVAFVAAIDFTHPTAYLSFIRYTILASPAVFAVLGALDFPRGKLLGQLVAVGTVLALAWLTVPRMREGAPPMEDWRTLARYLQDHSDAHETVAFVGHDLWIPPGMGYIAIQYYTPDFQHPWLILNSTPSPEIEKQLAGKSLWIYGRGKIADASSLLPGWEKRDEFTTSAGFVCHMVPSISSGF